MAFTYYHPTASGTVLSTATALTAGVSAAATSLPVTLSTGTHFVIGRKLLLGTLGAVDAELVTIAAIPTTTSFTTEALVRAHSATVAVTSLVYDSVRMETATDAAGPWTLQETRPIDVANPRGTYFQYTGTTASHFRFRFYHTVTGAWEATGTTVVTPSDDASSYTTIAAYKAYAGITGVDQDEEIFTAIGAATAAINSYLFGDSTQSLLSTTYTEKVTTGQQGSDILVLRHAPITAVTSITLEGTVLYSSTVSLLAIDALDGYLVYLDSALPGGGPTYRKPITVVYTAGYSTVPADVELACQQLLAISLSRDLRDAVGVRAYSIGSKRVEFETGATTGGSKDGAIPASVRSLLAPYRRTKFYTWP